MSKDEVQDDDQPRIEKSANYAEIYFNYAQVGITGFDVYAYLSETSRDSEGKMVIRQKGRLTMAPAEAKLLAIFLRNAVVQYESTFGKITLDISEMGMVSQSDQGTVQTSFVKNEA